MLNQNVAVKSVMNAPINTSTQIQDQKCAIIVNEALPLGQIANAVAVLTVSIGMKHPEMVGYELEDQDGHYHAGITTLAIPVLKGGDKLGKMRAALKREYGNLTVVDVTSATSVTRSYDEYAERLKTTPVSEIEYYGIAVYGPKKLVNQYTGSLGLLR
jgi:hypothetical protein